MPIILEKQRELCLKEVKNILRKTKNSVAFNHLTIHGVQHIFNMNRIAPSLFSDIDIVDDAQNIRASYINLVQQNTRIIDRNPIIGIFFYLKKQLKLKNKNQF